MLQESLQIQRALVDGLTVHPEVAAPLRDQRLVEVFATAGVVLCRIADEFPLHDETHAEAQS